MVPGYSCILTVVSALLVFWMAWSTMLSFWCLRFHRQRNVLYEAFNDAVEGKIGLYIMLSKELVDVLD